MQIVPGVRLAQYEITAAIGKGGMGEVFRAKDTKLGRDVAIKVLPEEFTRDPERLGRFEREARVLASLNHPHIASIYGLEESEGIRFLAMELAEGEDLSRRIERGAIPIEEAVPIAVQIAEALEAAHEKGIIHRDLKPANIKLSDDGQVKLLDFGLAKALEVEQGDSDLSNSPTMVRAATHAGVILGTAAYMSPEQARGKKVDRRADVWAFGVVLYEMLTGTRLFTGETVSDTLAAVLRGDVDLTLLPKGVPPHVVRLIARCTDRDAKRRLRDIGEARIALTDPGASELQPQASTVMIDQRGRQRGWIAATFVLLACCIALAATHFARRAPAAEPLALSVALPPDMSLALTGIQPGPPEVSPDGRSIAFVAEDAAGTRRLWVRELGSPAARALEGTESASYPFWSWDGRDLGFFANQKLKRVPAAGGSVLTVAQAPSGKGGAWNRDGVIVFCPSFNSALYKVNATGGDAAPVTTIDAKRGDSSHRFPQFLSDGRRFIYLVRRRTDKENEIRVASLDGGVDAMVVKTERHAFAAGGWLFYMRDQTLVAQRFDESSASLSGEPKPIAEGVNGIAGAARVVASAAGSTLVYQVGDSSSATQLVWLDATGREVGEIGPPGQYDAPSISPDGKRIAVQKVDASTGMNDIWIVDLTSGNSERVTFESGNEFGPVWSPDGTRIAYASNARGPYDILVKRVDGSSEAVPVVKTDDSSAWPAPQSWSAAGNLLVYTVEATSKGGLSVFAVSADGGGEPKPILDVPYRESAPRVSPDGRWLSFAGHIDGGAPGIFVTDFPAAKRRWQVTRGVRATWSPDGRRLAFVDSEMSLSVIDVRPGGVDFEWGEAKRLFRLGDGFAENAGDRYLSRRWSIQSRRAATTLDLLLNWQKIAAGD